MKVSPTNSEFGDFVRKRRLKLGLSQYSLARLSGIGQWTIVFA